jgi:hypothetical protein
MQGCGSVITRVYSYQSGMQRAAILSSEASLAPPYFSMLPHKRHDFRKKGTERKMCALIFSTIFN